MRTYSEVTTQLTELLTTPVWSNLKRKLLGKELITLAANAVFMSDKGYNIFFRNFFPDTADFKGLLYQSNFHKVPVTNFRPSILKVKMKGESEGFVYPPYTLVITAGNLNFTNIDYIKDAVGEVATFYQGNLKRASSATAPRTIYRAVTNQALTHQVTSSDPYDYRTEAVLPTHALPESLRVFATDTEIPIQERNGINPNLETYDYTVYTGLDKTLRIQFGDDLVSKALPLTEVITLYYLELTFNTYKDSIPELSYPSDVGPTLPPTQYTNESDIISQIDGIPESLEAARHYLIRKIAEKSGVISEPQIISFAKTYTDVLDVIIPSTDLNTINVIIKPTIFGDDSFEGLQSDLQLYGELVTQYLVNAADPLYFSILIETVNSVSDNSKNYTTTQLDEAFAYEVIGFFHPISQALVTDIVRQSLVSTPFTAKIVITETILEKKTTLSLQPIEASIQVFKLAETRELQAWDSEGRMLGFLTTELISYHKFFPFRDFILLKEGSLFKVFNPLLNSITHINCPTEIEASVYTDNNLYAQTSDLTRLYRFSSIGWSLEENNNVSLYNTSLLPDKQYNLDDEFPTDFFTALCVHDNKFYISAAQDGDTNLLIYTSDTEDTLTLLETIPLLAGTEINPSRTYKINDYIIAFFKLSTYVTRAFFFNLAYTEGGDIPRVGQCNIETIFDQLYSSATFDIQEKTVIISDDLMAEVYPSITTTYINNYLDLRPYRDKEYEFAVNTNDVIGTINSDRVTVIDNTNPIADSRILVNTPEGDTETLQNETLHKTLLDVGSISYQSKQVVFTDKVSLDDIDEIDYRSSSALSSLSDKYGFYKGTEWNVT